MGTSTRIVHTRKRIALLALAAVVAAMLAVGATGALADESQEPADQEGIFAQSALSAQDDVTPQATTATTMHLFGSYSSPYTGSAIPYAGEVTVQDASGNTITDPTLTYAYYTDSACTIPTTTENSGAASEGAAPVNKGAWYVKVSYAGNSEYGSCSAITGYGITTIDEATGLAYVILDDTAPRGAGAYVASYTGTSKDITVPAQLGGQNVVAIALESLSLTSLDTSACGANLVYLDCMNNQLASLDVSANTALTAFNCSNNQLTSIDTSACGANLVRFDCMNNQLTSIDMSANTALKSFVCDDNLLTSLDVSKNTALVWLSFERNNLTSIDVSANKALATFFCNGNKLTALDVSNNIALKALYCEDNQIAKLDLSANTALTKLDCSNNKLDDLDISANIALTTLRCMNNYIADPTELKTITGRFGTEDTVPQYITRMVGVSGILASYAHTGEAIQPEPTVKYNDGATLTKDTDYTVTYYAASDTTLTTPVTPKDNGDYTVAVKGTGNYAGTITMNFTIADTVSNMFTFETWGDESDFAGTYIDGLADGVTATDIVIPATLGGHNVTTVYLPDLSLTSLDTSACGANLKFLICPENDLTSLDVSSNTALFAIFCQDNQLTSLDVSANTALYSLACSRNQLTSIDLSKNTDLSALECARNQLTSLNVGNNTKIRYLNCSFNKLTSLDISNNAALMTLRCEDNKLTSLDISGNPALTTLYCHYNLIYDTSALEAWLATVGNTGQVVPQSCTVGLTSSYTASWTGSPVAYGGTIMVRDVAGKIITDPELSYTYYTDKACTIETTPENSGAASEGEAPANSGVWYVTVSCADSDSYGPGSASTSYAITKTDEATGFVYTITGDTGPYGAGAYVVGYTGTSTDLVVPEQLGGANVVLVKLTDLSLTSLDTNACGANLKYLGCWDNELTTLNVSKNTALTKLVCTYNKLASLDVSKNTALTELFCDNNKLVSLDVSNNAVLVELECENNQLATLDVSKNTALDELECYGNQLTTLDLSKNTALSHLCCYGNQLTSLDVSKNEALEYIDCSNNKLTSLDVSNNTALAALYCYDNQLTSLDTSACGANLKRLDCMNNQLTSLDVSKNTALDYLVCDGNQLTTLDVSSNPKLTWLSLEKNQVTSLDVSANKALETLYCNDNQISNLDVSANKALKALYCNDNKLTSLDISGNTALATLHCECNKISDTSALESWLETGSGQVLPQNRDKLIRLSGAGRYETMAAIVNSQFGSGQYYTAILATGANYPDALAASGLAGLGDYPVVLIDGSLATAEGTPALAQLQRMGVKSVVIVGGEGAVSAGISDSLVSDGLSVSRVSGGSRVDTAIQIYKTGKTWGSGWGDTVIVATSAGFADALSVSPLSYSAHFPIILTDASGNLTDAAKSAIESGGFEHAIIVGGTAAVSADTESWLDDQFWTDDVVRLAGSSRYATSSEIAAFSTGQGDYTAYPADFGYTALTYARPGIATGSNFPDALSGAAVCGRYGSVLLLASDSDTTCISGLASNKAAVQCAYVFGGTSAVSDSLYSRIGAALN